MPFYYLIIADKVQLPCRSHRIIAILPFDVQINATKLPKNVTHEMVLQQQEETGYSMQSNVYTYFLKEASKNKYTIEFQDVDKPMHY